MQSFEAENRIAVQVPADMPLLFEADDVQFASQFKKYIVGSTVCAGGCEIEIIAGDSYAYACAEEQEHLPLPKFTTSGEYSKGACVVKREHTPPKAGLHFRKELQRPFGRDGEHTVYSLELMDGSADPKPIGHFEFGTVPKLSSRPLYMLGCGLADADPAWVCFHAPWSNLYAMEQLSSRQRPPLLLLTAMITTLLHWRSC